MNETQTREYLVRDVDPLALARAFRIPVADVAVRVGVSSDWVRHLATDYDGAQRVRRAVLELALERHD